jgi:hypothetical protein
VNLDGGTLKAQAERFFGVASAMARNILTNTQEPDELDSDEEQEDDEGRGEPFLKVDVVMSDELAEYARLRRAHKAAERHPAVSLWRAVEALPASTSLYGEIMRAARLGLTLVGTSVCDERAFSAMTFIKNVLRTSLSTNLALCMRMKLQQWFDLDTFPYHAL